MNGVLTKLNVPGATSAAIMGVNDYGDLIGFYLKLEAGCTFGIYHGFIWYHQNVIKTLDFSDITGFCGSDAGKTMPDELFVRMWMLPLTEPGEFLFAYRTCQIWGQQSVRRMFIKRELALGIYDWAG